MDASAGELLVIRTWEIYAKIRWMPLLVTFGNLYLGNLCEDKMDASAGELLVISTWEIYVKIRSMPVWW